MSAGFVPFQNLIHESGGAPEDIGTVLPVRYETASFYKSLLSNIAGKRFFAKKSRMRFW